ncbi:serine/threonine-protein kinase Nek8 [Anopheles ziemanni]|uniref:serine/threonine-protein kinase Nek8 n=1 Tax=Anopheles coustani TaxID=139045 RepID=UPI002659E558|nr:serine/threonine-protein kinase Nek8 [Anopheles coustani]XP_058178429.1 serine/threonine-protein kinase Nek8 [Anopheles ziemanni]
MELKEIRRAFTIKPGSDPPDSTPEDLSVMSRFNSFSLHESKGSEKQTTKITSSSEEHVSRQQQTLELTGYRRIRTVGQGSFGVAILYERRSDGQQVVMKQIALNDLTVPERKMAMNEVEVFSQLHHPNIIAYHGSSVRGELLLIEMEYADGGTLAQLLAERSHGEPLPERFVLNIFEQLVSAISYMHSQSILHRDLKTANVFLHGRGTVKVGDFGISKIINTKVHAQTVLGTPYYFSPEMCEGKVYDEKSDIWALGCILGEMCCLKKAFTATNLSELVTKIMTAEYVPLPGGYSDSLRHVLALMFRIDPTARPSASELLQYWIPLVYRKLGTTERLLPFSYSDFQNVSGCLIAAKQGLPVEAKLSTNRTDSYPGSTVLITDNSSKMVPMERTVLYQLHSFGTSSSMAPLHLPPTLNIRSVATRGQHFVAVMEDGSVYSWGEGHNGQLGHDALETWHHIPMRIEAIKQYRIVGATVGEGFTILQTDTGTLLSCGDNSHGCLGHGNKNALLVPKPIVKLDGSPVVQVSSGTTHVLALTESGLVYSWGSSSHGALALGKRITVALEPERVILPQLVQNAREVYAGPDCTILITRQDDCYCCGSNAGNRLGLGRKVLGTNTLRRVPLDIGRQKIVAVSVEATHAAFLLESGYLVTLGDNAHGQRGAGHRLQLSQPTIVGQLKSRFIVNVKTSQTYTVATTDDNCVVLWGTRMGTPDDGTGNTSDTFDRNNNAERPCLATIANNTVALANILTSIYKHETILDPTDILALYTSKDQQDRDLYVKLLDVHPLPHSILVLVKTNCPLV